MKKVVKLDYIPEESLILNDFDKINYFDTYKIQTTSNDYTVDKITTDIFKVPKWIISLMQLRNILVKTFGLKTGDKNDIKLEPYYPIGSKAVYFTVINRNENEIVMAENDKHLNFRTSVMLEKTAVNNIVYLSTIVKFNNSFGKLYFLLIKPFHRIIVKSLLKTNLHEN